MMVVMMMMVVVMLPLFAHMQPLDVLLEIPFATKLFVAKLTLYLLLNTALVVHVAKHDAAGRVPFAALEAGIVLSIFSPNQAGLIEAALGIAPTVQVVRQGSEIVIITPQLLCVSMLSSSGILCSKGVFGTVGKHEIGGRENKKRERTSASLATINCVESTKHLEVVLQAKKKRN
uniref:Putative secreted protein n=1 Tax=Anopheles darlingi TaxID=43151 RepID=A0A2M4DGX9_ANODA